MFQCDMCGECCRNLDKSDVYAQLHNGNGICKYLVGNKCSIYIERPLLCRVEESYKVFFQNVMSEEEFYNKNYEVCNKLKEEKRLREEK